MRKLQCMSKIPFNGDKFLVKYCMAPDEWICMCFDTDVGCFLDEEGIYYEAHLLRQEVHPEFDGWRYLTFSEEMKYSKVFE